LNCAHKLRPFLPKSALSVKRSLLSPQFTLCVGTLTTTSASREMVNVDALNANQVSPIVFSALLTIISCCRVSGVGRQAGLAARASQADRALRERAQAKPGEIRCDRELLRPRAVLRAYTTHQRIEWEVRLIIHTRFFYY
jgi:hypothetical protein